MVNMNGKIFISIVASIIVMTMGYIVSATEIQPIGREFEVVSEGFHMLTECPRATTMMPEAAMIAKEKNQTGAMIICDDFGEMPENPAMAMFMRYTRIHVSCMLHNEMSEMSFLYHAEITGLWTCMNAR